MIMKFGRGRFKIRMAAGERPTGGKDLGNGEHSRPGCRWPHPRGEHWAGARKGVRRPREFSAERWPPV